MTCDKVGGILSLRCEWCEGRAGALRRAKRRGA